MISSIKEYPCDITEHELDSLIEYIENTNLSSHPLAAKTDNNFLDNDIPILNKLKKSFYDSCAKYWGIDVTKYSMKSWIYIDWKNNTKKPFVHTHNYDDPHTLSGIMFLRLPKGSTTTLFPIPHNDDYYLPDKLLTWFIFPSIMPHLPGTCNEVLKRYTLSADLHPTKLDIKSLKAGDILDLNDLVDLVVVDKT